MKAMMSLLAFSSLLITFTSGSPALAARQSATLSPSPTPTACPYPTVPTGGSWMAAATNIAAIPTGLLTPCQLGCLGMSLPVILFRFRTKLT